MVHHAERNGPAESESPYRAIFEQAAVGIAEFDLASCVIRRVNQRYCEIFDLPADRLLGRPWTERSHPDDQAIDAAHLQQLHRGEIRSLKIEKRLQHRDGTFRWFHLTLSLVGQGDHASSGVVIVEDITDRKNVQQQLLLTKFSVDSCSVCVFWIRQDASFFYVNDATTRQFGYDREELLAMTVHDIDPAYSAEVWPDYWQRMRQQGMLTFESKVRHKNATMIPVEITTNLLEFEGKEYVFAFVTDISERKRTDDARRKDQELLEFTNRLANVGGWELDLETMELLWSTQTCRIHEVPTDFQPDLESAIEFYAPESRPIIQAAVEAGIRDGTPWDLELPFITAKGNRRWVRAQGTAERKDGKPVRLHGAFHDVTTRKEAEEESRRHRDVLAHVTRLSTMGELVAGIAHEVRQPLYAITNFATATSVALKNVAQPETVTEQWIDELKEWNDGVKQASKRASEIIKRLRQFAQKGESRHEEVNVTDIVSDSIELVAFEARQVKVTVETDLQEELPSVVADRIQCEQVMVNLLHNAYEALSESEQPRRVVVRAQFASDQIELQVDDNGPGIPVDQQGKLFEAFYTTKPSGMGMGLAISRTIIEDHGGRLWGSLNDSGGATFHFTLPCRSEAEIT